MSIISSSFDNPSGTNLYGIGIGSILYGMIYAKHKGSFYADVVVERL